MESGRTVVSLDLLQRLARQVPREPARQRTGSREPGSDIDLGGWLQDHQLSPTGPKDWKGGRLWVFEVCPWNDAHTDRSAYVVQFASGALDAGCHHNGCAQKDWHALRDLAEPGWRGRINANGARTPEAVHPRRAAANGSEQTLLRAPRGYTAEELRGMLLPPQRWAVPGIIPQGLTILAGGQKKGKSRLLYDATIAVATGGAALGKIKVEQGTALYLALEDNDRRLQDRLFEIMGDQPAPQNLHIYPEWPAIAEGGLAIMRTWLDEHPGTRLIAIDTLGAFRAGSANTKNVGAYQEDYELGRSLLRIALDYGLALLVAHHTNKREEWEDWSHAVSGTMGLTGAADATLLFERARGSDEARLRGTGRDVEDFDMALRWDETANIWVLQGNYDEVNRSHERVQILELIAQHGAMGPKDAADLLEKNYNTVKVLLLKMYRDGDLTRNRGKYDLPPVKPENEYWEGKE